MVHYNLRGVKPLFHKYRFIGYQLEDIKCLT
ncbi:hypothetical protein [Escherichia phage UPWr_E1]